MYNLNIFEYFDIEKQFVVEIIKTNNKTIIKDSHT